MKNYRITENGFDMSREVLYGSLFAISNGYMGIRGSFEENGSMAVQGAYVRGLIDEIPFNQTIIIDNEYMRRYYTNEDAAKTATLQEGVINFADVLLFKISIDGKTFYPWEGNVLFWERALDIEKDCLVRRVVWDNGEGDVTELCFERFASFDNDHICAIKVKIKPQNHSKEINITSGVDLRTKSNGFLMCRLTDCVQGDDYQSLELETKGKYKHKFNIGVANSFKSEKNTANEEFLLQEYTYKSEQEKERTFEKIVYISTSRDGDDFEKGFELAKKADYNTLFAAHERAWSEFFDKIDIKIEGDDEADRALRFCNYHTAISIPKNDAVHSLAAKNLTGEGYNDYVWWDCEIYQSPVFIYSGIDAAKNTLMYRYDRLDAARAAAKAENRRGARYPFISSVTGEEKVWKHVRHPFMQVHVVADVAWSVLNYYYVTDDIAFMKDYGIKMLTEIADYWVSRVEKRERGYEILCVTGCDEHHPFVNNDAYTNYLVKYVLENTIKIATELGETVSEEWRAVCEGLYLPMEKNGLIPQFDGYLDLSRSIEHQGGANTAFQMKTLGGMYHKSQIIKQPDVMVLFTHIHNSFDKRTYEVNWDYYEAMCEASSSLTFPVHSICAFDNNQVYKGYQYFLSCAKMDLEDEHNCAKDGVHAGCSAGAWYSIVRGMAGIEMDMDGVKLNPKLPLWWKRVSFKLKWHGTPFAVEIDADKCTIIPDGAVVINYGGKRYECKERTEFKL